DVSRSPEDSYALLEREGVTILNQTPSAFRQLMWVDEEAAERGEMRNLALRQVIFGGEALDPASLRGWVERRGDDRPSLVNMYGITETTVHVTWRVIRTEDTVDGSASPIGIPIPDLSVHLLDADGRLVPTGAAGEMYVGGAGVARGYLHRPGLTAQRFVPDPFSADTGARLYRSGDFARRLEDGSLEFLGRADDQVKVRGFRIELGEIEAALRDHPSVRDTVVLARGEGEERRLAAWVVAEGVDAAGLRAHLLGRLPEYMVPAAWGFLDALPLTGNGKVDRRALPEPGAAAADGDEYVAPRTPVEETLARVWEAVLRVERVGVHDDFFALGGDSILSLQVISRAAKEGVRVTPRQVFEHPTVAGLAAVAGGTGADAEQGLVTGPVPLTPVQRWFFDQEMEDASHSNLSMVVEAAGPVDPALLERALYRLALHHDALRLRFTRGADGWTQAGTRDAAVPVETVDLAAVAEDERPAAREEAKARAERGLELEAGPLLRALLLRGDGPDRVLLATHHLVVDVVSWRVLLEDLETAYGQVSRGEPVRLPPKTTSFRAWATLLERHAASDALRAEADTWLALADAAGEEEIPADHPGGANTTAERETFVVALGAEETRALLQELPAVHRTQINDALLSALARALAPWTGREAVWVELEGHGREELFEGVDLSRTAGWFTTLFPVRLPVGADDAPVAALAAVRDALRAVPARGIGYGVLRWMSPDAELRAALAALPRPRVSFNYLGRFDAEVGEGGGFFSFAAEAAGPDRAPGNVRPHLLDVNAWVSGGRLQVGWSFSRAVHDRATVERLATAYLAALGALVAASRGDEAVAALPTPADFPLAGLDQARLDALLAAYGGAREVEDVYPLTPLQEGMLFHARAEPTSGMYVEQVSATLRGVDADAFAAAWQAVADRHGILRTAFVAGDGGRPLQVVLRRAAVPVERLDWSALPAAERAARLAAHAEEDLRRGFDTARAPLLRLALIRTGPDELRTVLTFHHLLLDGWSLPRVYAEVGALYEAALGGRPAHLPLPRPFRDYVAWLEGRDPAAAEAFWRAALAGFEPPPPLGSGPAAPGRSITAFGELDQVMERAEAAALQAFARPNGLTLSTVFAGAWGVLLSRYTGARDVVFGSVVSGRPAELEGVEEMVGMLINTIPVRLQVEPGARVVPWLRALQAWQTGARAHEHAPLPEVQRWSGLPADRPLFETLYVFENFPMEAAAAEGGGERAEVVERGNYPLTLAVLPGEAPVLRLSYDAERFGAAEAAQMLGHLRTLLAEMAAHADDLPLGALPMLAADEERALRALGAAPPSGEDEGAVAAHRLFEAHARAAPGAVALVAGGGVRWTYAELDARADRVARRLRALGVGMETRVGVALERSPALVAALLGVLKAGGAYVSLDPALPPERLRWMAEDAGVAALVVDGELPPALGPLALPVLAMEGEEDGAPPAGALPDVPGEALAFVVYTSGSTGRPKGVGVQHAELARHCRAAAEAYGLGPADR
ncbi:MAG: condensation domain-containing protein, partial [Longimicrobiaceae bacterium]